jgi:hypothetical protein
VTHPDDLDRLASVATRARQDLSAATSLRPVPELRRPPGAQPTGQIDGWHRRLLRSPAIAALAVAFFVLGILVGARFGDDPWRHRAGIISVSAGDKPGAVATDGRTVWVADEGSGQLLAFDAATLDLRWQIAVGPRPVGLAYGLNAVWVIDSGDRSLRKIDPNDGHLLALANMSLAPSAVAVLDRVWVLEAGSSTVDGYDPQSLSQNRTDRCSGQSTSLSAGAGAIWLAAAGGVCRVPVSGGNSTNSEVPGAQSELIAVNSDAVWVGSTNEVAAVGRAPGDPDLRALDPTTEQDLARSALPGHATAMAAGDHGVAVATNDGTVCWFAAPGALPVTLARTGTPLVSLALVGDLLVGVNPDTGLLYRMVITP